MFKRCHWCVACVVLALEACSNGEPAAGQAVPEISVTPSEGLVTTEAGGTAAFGLVLKAQPSAEVTIALSTSDPTEATVSPSVVTFTSQNWNAPQIVTVSGVDDDLADGNIPFTIVTEAAVSSDRAFSGLPVSDVTAINTDDETAGVTIVPAIDMVTTEAGGTATFTVVLNSAPTAEVTIALSSSDASEGTASPAQAVFTPLNWKAPQTITVVGIDDDVADGDQSYSIVTGAAVSADSSYGGMSVADVAVSNTDDETAGVTIAPTTALTTSEAGGTATFTVVLNSEPTAEVSIALSSSDTSEGTASTALVVFTPLNWRAPQTITVDGVDDEVADGNQVYAIVTGAAVSADTSYGGMSVPDVTVSNTDDETAGVTIAPTTALVTTEAGGAATFTMALNSKPLADVVVAVSTSDDSEGTISPSSVTFTPLNWRAPKTFTVTGVDDEVADGNQPYSILTSAAESSDPDYGGMNVSDVTVSNTDDETAGVAVGSADNLQTSEAGNSATFSLALTSQPTADVTLAISTSNAGEGTVSPSEVTFTPLDWKAPQTVTASGVDDEVADGDQPYWILIAPAVSADPGYSGMDVADVEASNVDDDSAGMSVVPTTTLRTSEAGNSATFSLVLNSQPTADVTVAISTSNASEGTVSPAQFVFTALNWKIPQSANLTGVDDEVADGDQPYKILIAPAVSDDPGYSGMDVADVEASNVDDDSAGITVSPANGLVVSESGTTASFSLVLNSQPTAIVSLAISSSDASEGSVSPEIVTFTPADWRTPQMVTVTGVADGIADGDQLFTLITASATSEDPGYSGMNAADVSATNLQVYVTIERVNGVRGWSNGSFAKTCKEYRFPTDSNTLYQGETGDGVYRLLGQVDVFCDMTTDGGGWTLVGRYRDGAAENLPGYNDDEYSYFMRAQNDAFYGSESNLANPNSGAWTDWRVLANASWPIEFAVLLDMPTFNSGWERYPAKVIYRVKSRSVMPHFGVEHDLTSGDNLLYKFTPADSWMDVGSSSLSLYYCWYPYSSGNGYLTLFHVDNYRFITNLGYVSNYNYLIYFGSGVPGGNNSWYHTGHMLVR